MPTVLCKGQQKKGPYSNRAQENIFCIAIIWIKKLVYADMYFDALVAMARC
jgi:hypothetical protein